MVLVGFQDWCCFGIDVRCSTADCGGHSVSKPTDKQFWEAVGKVIKKNGYAVIGTPGRTPTYDPGQRVGLLGHAVIPSGRHFIVTAIVPFAEWYNFAKDLNENLPEGCRVNLKDLKTMNKGCYYRILEAKV